MSGESSVADTEEGQSYERGDRLGAAVTSNDGGSAVACTVNCEAQWSVLQMDVVRKLAQGNQLLTRVLPRAKRTAGHYAALYLSDEGTNMAGRFYWPGLGAFAAKQVVDGIDYAYESLDSWIGQVRYMAGFSLYYLVKGNLWVFLEVTPWMLFYKQYGHDCFQHCIARRNSDTFRAPVDGFVKRLPWASGPDQSLINTIESKLKMLDLGSLTWSKLNVQDGRGALAEMNKLQVTNYLRQGFAALRRFETAAPNRRGEYARQSASYFLDHEQRLHLQAMIYDHADFRFAWDNNDLGRWLGSFTGARDPDLVFSSAPAVTPQLERDQLRPAGLGRDDVSVRMALDDGKLYNATERMKYVKRILDQYHTLMQGRHRPYMIRQLRQIERWKDAT